MVENKSKYEITTDMILGAKEGNQEQLNEIIKINMPLVTSICKKFLNRGYEYEDLFQIGCIGLVKAIKNFDTNFNVKFSTYAVPMILGEIKRFFRDDGMIKVSRSVKSTAKKLYKMQEDLVNKNGKEPTIEELSEYSGISREEIIYAMEACTSAQYLYDVIHQDEGSPVLLIDKISNNDNEYNILPEKIALKEAIKDLDMRSRQVIILRYFKDKTQVQVAEQLGISQVQVSRIEKKVLKEMREKLSG